MFAIFTSSLILHPSSLIASPIANVEYVHKYIERATGITIPYKTKNIKQAANVKYLLATIDRANDLSPASVATDLQNHTLATEQAISVDSVWDATKRLYNCDEPGYRKIENIDITTGKGTSKCEAMAGEFFVKLSDMSAGDQFSFQISAAGSFTIDWGDGSALQQITKSDTTNTTYSHTYAAAGNYSVGLSGDATAYSTATDVAAISFYQGANNTKVSALAGDLGLVFPWDANLRFYWTFYGLNGLKTIPATLFASVRGAPTTNMFYATFWDTRLTSIPSGLFAGIVGTPIRGLFTYTFRGSTALTSIPADLFVGISGVATNSLFYSTFRDCAGLKTIPSGLFANIGGQPAKNMFYATFRDCPNLTTIPANLFGKFTGIPQDNMFAYTFWGDSNITKIEDGIWDLSGLTNASAPGMFVQTFYNDSKITSATPKIKAGSTVELWEHFSNYAGQDAFGRNTSVSNYGTIPAAWK